jgi:hypothetical protein
VPGEVNDNPLAIVVGLVVGPTIAGSPLGPAPVKNPNTEITPKQQTIAENPGRRKKGV